MQWNRLVVNLWSKMSLFCSMCDSGRNLGAAKLFKLRSLHSFYEHRFFCNLISGSNAFFPSNISLQHVAGTARPLGHCPEGPVADDRNNDLTAAARSPIIQENHIINLITRFP